MYRWFRRLTILLLPLMVCSCVAPSARSVGGEPPNLQVVSPTPPPIQPLAQQAPPLPNFTPMPSRGTCAPRYANGLHGSCVNGRACRGFGVRLPNGAVQCACYAQIGGCGEGFRCDALEKACVPESKPGFGRPEVG